MGCHLWGRMISLACLVLIAGCQLSTSPEDDSTASEFKTDSIESTETATNLREQSETKLPDEWQVEQTREWRHIVIHHTATNQGSVESIHEAHLKRKDSNGNPWMGIGYHFVIGNGQGMENGTTEPTFRWREQLHGAHAGNNDYNQHGIGIALVGNFEETPPTAEQLNAVKRLVKHLKTEYHIPSDRVIGHGEVKATACPGKYFPMTDVQQTESQSSTRTTD